MPLSVLRAAAVAAGAAGLLSATATASSPQAPTNAPAPTNLRAGRPLRVHSASLTQNIFRLVWTVKADSPFSPDELNRDDRSLCVLLERATTRVAVGEVCVKHPGNSHHVQLFYRHLTRAGAGAGHIISATVTRANGRELTASFLPGSVGLSYRSLRWQVVSSAYASACAATPLPGACAARFPAFPALARLHTPQLVGCTASGPAFVTGGSVSRHVIALTFDDGPWPDTPQFLDILEREHVHATFFQIGEQVGTYGGSVDRRMLADGDVIGDHTWNHVNVSGGGSFAAGEISRAAAAIRKITGGFQPCLFRAPGGAVSGSLISEARSMGFTTIQWDIDPRDWARPGTDAIYNNVVDNAHNGAIVIQHDGGGDRSETIAALPREIATLRARGYQFVTIPQLLGLRMIYL